MLDASSWALSALGSHCRSWDLRQGPFSRVVHTPWRPEALDNEFHGFSGSLVSCWMQKGPILAFLQGCWVPGSGTAGPDAVSRLEEGELLQNLRRALEKCRTVEMGAWPASACGCHLQSPQLLELGFSWEDEMKRGEEKSGSQTFFLCCGAAKVLSTLPSPSEPWLQSLHVYTLGVCVYKNIWLYN